MNTIDPIAFQKLSYGLFVVTAKDGEKENGCIINTATQVTVEPNRIAVTLNKKNLTHDMILHTGKLNLSILSEEAPFSVFTHFGFQSGRDTDKFSEYKDEPRSSNGLRYLSTYTSAYLSGAVIDSIDCGTHTLFLADVTQAAVLSDVPPATYAFYFAHIKPKPVKKESAARVYVCKICGYIYDEAVEGVPFEELPDDYVCPICKHPKSDFELQQ